MEDDLAAVERFSFRISLTYRQNNTIEDATRTIFETEEVGLGTMTELQRQRDVLTSASEKAKDTVSLAMQANTILTVQSVYLCYH